MEDFIGPGNLMDLGNKVESLTMAMVPGKSLRKRCSVFFTINLFWLQFSLFVFLKTFFFNVFHF